MAENQKLADKQTEQLQHEITKVTEATCQLIEETRHEIQLGTILINYQLVSMREYQDILTAPTREYQDILTAPTSKTTACIRK
jgi:hypothetical protein